ncbi:MAG: cytosine permease [Clostridiaceae bacterium]|nr:cytosine permease [Clostridiaceae bacterium]
MESAKSSNIERKALSQITESERQNWTSIAFIWIGTMICIPMLMVGGIFSASMTLANTTLAAFIGFAICSLIMVLTGIQGTDLGLPCTMCATKAFGDRGSSFLMSVVILIAQLGWFGVQTATCAAAFNTLLMYWSIPFPFWLSCVIWGGVMLFTAVYGFKFMKILNYIAVPALVVLCCYGAIYAINTKGFSNLIAFLPETAMPLSTAVSIVIGLFAVGTVINADFSRYAKSRVDTAKATVLGVLPAAVLMIFIGAVMAMAAGNYDITVVFASLGMPVISMLVLILATWTTNTGNAYTAGLAAMKVFSFKDELRPIVTLVCGAAGTIVAIAGLAAVLQSFISILSSLVPPIAGIMIADYWIIGKGNPENWYPVKGINWIGILSWAAGSVVALFFSFFSPALDGILTCLVAYLILNSLFGKTSLAGGGRIDVGEMINLIKEEAI